MHVYDRQGGTEYYVAESLDDARAVARQHLLEHDAFDEQDILDFGELDEMKQVDDAEIIGICCDADGDPSEPGADGVEAVARTAAEWAACRPRGFLCTTEY